MIVKTVVEKRKTKIENFGSLSPQKLDRGLLRRLYMLTGREKRPSPTCVKLGGHFTPFML